MNVQLQLSRDIKNIFITLDDLAISAEDPVVKPASKPEFGDYQVDGILSIAKKKRLSPRELAFIISQHLNSAGYIRHAEVAGPGFINITLSDDFLIKEINKSLLSDRLSVSLVPHPDTVVVDYSSPNIAKEMHVGNIRSTIIGDAVVRTLEFLGHRVIRANHIGDWGTQFGMLIAYMKHYDLDQEPLSIGNLEELYRNARKKYDADADFANESRDYVVRLQCGDKGCQRIWQRLVDTTMAQNQDTYDRLGVSLQHQDIMGESLYSAMLPTIVKDLKARGLARESEGATVVYLDEARNRQGAPMGVIIKKRDGGYLYSTTDIACAKYRYETYQPNRMLYYVDSRQNQHLEQAWQIARAANYVPAHVKLEHHMFGMMLGKDGRPFKTRSGGTVKLSQLLNESVKRAKILVREKRPDLKKNDIDNIAEMVGIGAIKYSDLAKNRVTDYIFDWDNMLSFTGNTAPYIQYAHARIHSLINKDDHLAQGARVACLENAIEKKLALQLLQFEEVLTQVAQEGTPHLLCSYLYQLSTTYSVFYESCAILAATSSEIRTSRMALSTLTAKTLAKGLELLGIPAPTEM